MAASNKVNDGGESTKPLLENENGVMVNNETISFSQALK